NAGEQPVHHVGQRGFVLGAVHAVMMHLMAQRLGHRFKRVVHDAAFGGLAVFYDERDLHGASPDITLMVTGVRSKFKGEVSAARGRWNRAPLGPARCRWGLRGLGRRRW